MTPAELDQWTDNTAHYYLAQCYGNANVQEFLKSHQIHPTLQVRLRHSIRRLRDYHGTVTERDVSTLIESWRMQGTSPIQNVVQTRPLKAAQITDRPLQ